MSRRLGFSILESLFASLVIFIISGCTLYASIQYKRIIQKKRYTEIASSYIDSQIEKIRNKSSRDFNNCFPSLGKTSSELVPPSSLPKGHSLLRTACVDMNLQPSNTETGIRLVSIDIDWMSSSLDSGRLTYTTVITSN